MKAQERPALRQHCVSRQQGQVGETRVCRHRGRRERANGVKNEKPSRRRERGEGGGGERRVTHTHTHIHTLSLSLSRTKKRGGGGREGCWNTAFRREQGLGLSWKVGTARYNTRLPLPAAISVNCSVPDKKNVGKIKFSSVIHHEATDAGRARSVPIGWPRPDTVTWPRSRTRPLFTRQRPVHIPPRVRERER